MSDDLLIIWHAPARIVPHLIVIALSCEIELTIQPSDSVVFIFEVMSLLHVAKVLMEFVGEASDE